ncbi:hypothetical protein L9G15_06410, partial [Shewanella sp. A3A]|nr:hypothetical protein [Shewanella ferrihydritica]
MLPVGNGGFVSLRDGNLRLLKIDGFAIPSCAWFLWLAAIANFVCERRELSRSHYETRGLFSLAPLSIPLLPRRRETLRRF